MLGMGIVCISFLPVAYYSYKPQFFSDWIICGGYEKHKVYFKDISSTAIWCLLFLYSISLAIIILFAYKKENKLSVSIFLKFFVCEAVLSGDSHSVFTNKVSLSTRGVQIRLLMK